MPVKKKYLGRIYDTLVSILAEIVSFMDVNDRVRVNIQASDIQVPVDLRSAVVERAEIYGQSLTAAGYILTLDKGGMGKVSVDGHFATGGVTVGIVFTVDYSHDGFNWFNDYTSAAAEVDIAYMANSSAQYWRIVVLTTGAGNDTVDLILAGVN